jgi:hypothetical protein
MPERGARPQIERESGIDLYWLPLGAGGHFVKYNGRVYEWIKAHVERRPTCDLYHSALQVELPEDQYVIEQTPEPDLSGTDRGVVAEGPVGSRWAGRFRPFRYEIRVWRGGHIPDIAEAVDSPKRLFGNRWAVTRERSRENQKSSRGGRRSPGTCHLA